MNINKLLFALLTVIHLTSLASAQVVTGDSAINVLGQFGDTSSVANPVPSFTKSGSNNSPYYYGFSSPVGFAIDSNRHRLFVADSGNNRILVYNLSSTHLLLDRIPDFVIGQSSFVTLNQSASSTSVNLPRALVFDPVYDQLIVADTNNHRILFFDVSNLSNGLAASYVLGQANFTTNGSALSKGGLNTPSGVALKSATSVGGNRTLYVSDRQNNRVLIYSLPQDPTGVAPSTVLGQSNYTTSTTTTPSSQMNQPGGLALDSTNNRLFVPCSAQGRVLVYDVTSPTDGMAATRVLGQASLSGISSGNSASQLNTPTSVAYDAANNRLFVAASGNRRVTVYSVGSAISDITNGQAATNILGQSDFSFTSSQNNQFGTAIGTSGKQDLFFDPVSSQLYVAQQTHRVSIFDASSISDGENAVNLLGQYDPTNIADPQPNYIRIESDATSAGRLGFNTPSGIALDSTRHRLFVVDGFNHRVLVYNLDSNNELIDYVADFVLGQTDFTGRSTGSSAANFSSVSGASLLYDSAHDRLFLSINTQNRVLVFDTSTIDNGEDAIHVLGQTNFVSNGSGTTASSLGGPQGMAYDSENDRLFVSDSFNNRVLVFTNMGPSGISNGKAATYVLGQPDFATVSTGTSAAKANRPRDVAYDSARKRLYVADYSNRRVLVFDVDPATLASGQDATHVIGQSSFTASINSTSQDTLNSALSVAIDTDGDQLFVVNDVANRVMVFNTASLATTGQAATAVLGQSDFTSSSSGFSAAKLNTPQSVEFDPIADRVYISDGNAHRVVVFSTSTSASYSSSLFSESNANDGSIDTSIGLTLRNATFTSASGTLSPTTDFTVSNVPAGLSVVVTRTSRSTAAITLVGNATSHESSSDVANLSISLLSNAFSNRLASSITGSTKSDFAIQFADAPTPTSTPTFTPSFTPSFTPTFTPTPSPTATFTATFTATVVPTVTPTYTATITALPSVTSTPVGPPSITPTVSPTVVSSPSPEPSISPAPPTPRATPSATEISGRVVINGAPIEGAIVYVSGLGVVVTDGNGEFRIPGAVAGLSYSVTVQIAGAQFPTNSLTASSGEFTELSGTALDFNPRLCAENNITSLVFDAAKGADELYRRIVSSVQSLKSKKERFRIRAVKQLGSYFGVSAKFPAVVLSCEAGVGCSQANLKPLKNRLRARIIDLRRQNLFANRTLRVAGLRSRAESAEYIRQIARICRRSFLKIRALPARSDLCG